MGFIKAGINLIIVTNTNNIKRQNPTNSGIFLYRFSCLLSSILTIKELCLDCLPEHYQGRPHLYLCGYEMPQSWSMILRNDTLFVTSLCLGESLNISAWDKWTRWVSSSWRCKGDKTWIDLLVKSSNSNCLHKPIDTWKVGVTEYWLFPSSSMQEKWIS